MKELKNRLLSCVLAIIMAVGMLLPFAGCGAGKAKKPTVSEVIWLGGEPDDDSGYDLIEDGFDDKYESFAEADWIVYRLGNGQFRIVDYAGNPVTESDWDYVGSFSEGLTCVYKNRKGGYINAIGEIVIPLEYGHVGDFHGGYAEVGSGTYGAPDSWSGFIDTAGNFYEYNAKYEFYNDIVGDESESSLGTINKTDKVAMPTIKRDSNDQYSVLDIAGKVIIPPGEYDIIKNFCEGFACVANFDKGRIKYKYGFVNNKGKLVIPMKYAASDSDELPCFHCGLACVENDSKYGFIDTNGNEIVPLEYDFAGLINNGEIGLVKKGSRWGFFTIIHE